MAQRQRVSAIPSGYLRQRRFRKPTSKELDLFLLAGCSCLLTVLYHPVAEALQTSSLYPNGPTSGITAQARTTFSNSMNAFHLTLLPSRDEVGEEETDA
jgi:hypothetical protein